MHLDDHGVFTFVGSVEHEGVELVRYFRAVAVFDRETVLAKLSRSLLLLSWLFLGGHKVLFFFRNLRLIERRK